MRNKELLNSLVGKQIDDVETQLVAVHRVQDPLRMCNKYILKNLVGKTTMMTWRHGW